MVAPMKTNSLGSLLMVSLLSWATPSAQPRGVIADLSGPTWQLVQFQGSDGKTLTPDDKTKYTLAFGAEGTANVRIDCNRGRGAWRSPGPNQLEFGPLALTRAMCPSAPLNDRIPKDWQYVRSYTLKDGHLFLSLMADGGIYEFEPVSAQGTAEVAGAAGGAVKGTATYRERMALPPGAVFEAILEDVSKADAPGPVIGRARIEKPGNPPIPFEIPYDPSRIDPSHQYAVRARIVSGGKLLFTAEQHYSVPTAGQGSEVHLLLRLASAPSGVAGGSHTATASTEPLENTYWKLIRLGDTAVTVAPQQKEPHFVLNSQTRRVGGSGGCNQLTGSYQLNADHLTFSQMAGTMMACLEGMDTEKAFLQALPQVSTWKITGQHLELFDASGKVIASFEARHMK